MTPEEKARQEYLTWVQTRDLQVKTLADKFSVSTGVVLGIYFTMSMFFETHPRPKLPEE